MTITENFVQYYDMKRNSDSQQFHQYQQNEQSPLS